MQVHNVVADVVDYESRETSSGARMAFRIKVGIGRLTENGDGRSTASWMAAFCRRALSVH